MKSVITHIHASPITFFVALGSACSLVILLSVELLSGGRL